MSTPNNDPNGLTPHKKPIKIPDYLSKAANATPGSSLRRLVGNTSTSIFRRHLQNDGSSTPTRNNNELSSSTPNEDDLAGWLSSVRTRISKALKNDDKQARELQDQEDEYKRRKLEMEQAETQAHDENEEARSSAFEKLGSLLYSFYGRDAIPSKRPFDDPIDDLTPSEKRMKLDMVCICWFTDT